MAGEMPARGGGLEGAARRPAAVPPGELLIHLLADERLGPVTRKAEAPWQRSRLICRVTT